MNQVAHSSDVALHWNRESISGWGGAVQADSEILRPKSTHEVRAALLAVVNAGKTLGLRGAGCSYGDAATNHSGKLLDLKQMNQILEFDPESGSIRVQPGVTIRQLWEHAIPHGYWPSVVPGTMNVSVGGAASMNIHGKNNYAVGSFGEHVNGFEILTPNGETIRCSRDENSELFHGAIGGFGMLGCMTNIEIQLKRIYSERMKVSAFVVTNFEDQLRRFEELKSESDYLVSWVNLYAKGSRLGEGVLHQGVNFRANEDQKAPSTFCVEHQHVPRHMLGFFPKQWIWPFMWVTKNLGLIPMVNATKMKAGRFEERKGVYLQSHGAFHFLLDYVPRWHWMTKPGGLIQFQPFVPFNSAHNVLCEIVEECHRSRLIPYLGVLKRHRKDPFLMTHGIDGYSLAMDFAVSTNPAQRKKLWNLCERMTEKVLAAGGRFYYAKDLTLLPSCPEKIHGASALSKFRALKRRHDPANILQSDLAKRLEI